MPLVSAEHTRHWASVYKPLFDSRRLLSPQQTVFFALTGAQRDGHDFILNLYQKGVRRFVVSRWLAAFDTCTEAEFLQTASPLRTLQTWASQHRAQFDIPIVAITGSNGKTIVKEWLYQLLDNDFAIVKSPKSYNSQLGVPISVLEMNARHQLAIFEAGISTIDEMEHLQRIIRPTIGILTNIGQAHSEGFPNDATKLHEKLKLFVGCDTVIYHHTGGHCPIAAALAANPAFAKCTLLAWGDAEHLPLRVQIEPLHNHQTLVRLQWIGNWRQAESLVLPFTDAASIENSLHAIVAALALGVSLDTLAPRLHDLHNVPMRLQRKAGDNNCTLIDDSYNNDLAGLRIALDFLRQQGQELNLTRQTLILSDMLEAGKADAHLYQTIADLVRAAGVQRLIGVGAHLYQHRQAFDLPETHFYQHTPQLLADIGKTLHFKQEAILIKGARLFGLERVVQILQKRVHQTMLEINLSAMANNLQFYRQLLHPSTKLMAMVKAFAYGSGGYEVAQLLEYHHVDYLGVAYTDEGVALRQRGIDTPIMIMNATEQGFGQLVKYRLEPAMYSWRLLQSFVQYLEENQLPMHPIYLEVDTGMRRLGFAAEEWADVLAFLQQKRSVVRVVGMFSHLAAAEEASHDAFTQTQIDVFQRLAAAYESTFQTTIIKHILNSAGIARWTPYQLDMVRLGIGLHGIDTSGLYSPHLQAVASLRTTISQIRTLQPSESVGYSRKGRTDQPTRVATIAIGYADGFLRIFGNGRGRVLINGKLCPTIGNVCMDMAFVDLGDTAAQEGDEVIIFGAGNPIEAVAQRVGTISYEILTNISERVPRIFYE